MSSAGGYSFGIGDRFGRQGVAQLRALAKAWDDGREVVPVWNKSPGEHAAVGSVPMDVRREAEAAVEALGWKRPYFVDADHVCLKNVGLFIVPCDFFTLDVASAIGGEVAEEAVAGYVDRHLNLLGEHVLPGGDKGFAVRKEDLEAVARRYLAAIKEARKLYSLIRDSKGDGEFVVELSMDETVAPQTAKEIFLILAAVADEDIPINTFAPRFSGRFNKGIDYAGDPEEFALEFDADIAVLELAVAAFGLPGDLRLSLHSGSDKFSIYPMIKEALERRGAGVHVKTSGTTWLEEVVGLAEAGGDALEIVKAIYRKSLDKMDELVATCPGNVDLNVSNLPAKSDVDAWSSDVFAAALRHVSSNGRFNPHFRQIMHMGYKVAAGMGNKYLDLLDEHVKIIAENVETNILVRHVKAIFPKRGDSGSAGD